MTASNGQRPPSSPRTAQGCPDEEPAVGQALLEFQAVLAVVQKNGSALGRTVAAIARGQRCYVPAVAPDGSVPSMQEFLDTAESHLAEVLPCADAPPLPGLTEDGAAHAMINTHALCGACPHKHSPQASKSCNT